MTKYALLFLTLIHLPAFADRAVAVLDRGTGARVILEGASGAVRFYACTGQTDVALEGVDLSACDPLVGGRAFTDHDMLVAMQGSGGRSPARFIITDSAYGVRQLVRSLRGEPVDGRQETTYMGSAEGYQLATSVPQQVKFLSAFVRALGRDMGAEENSVIYVGQGASGYFEGVRDGITALLLYANE